MSEQEGDWAIGSGGSGGRGSGSEDLESVDSSEGKAPTMKALVVRVGKPTAKMRSQEVGVVLTAVPLSLIKKLQRPSWTNHHPKLPQKWTTTSHRLPQSLSLMTRIQRMNGKTIAMNSHTP